MIGSIICAFVGTACVVASQASVGDTSGQRIYNGLLLTVGVINLVLAFK